jgi:membrane associated rhomboid family serine protease
MGYQDRDYFREEHTPYLDLIRSTRVCWGVVIAIALVACLCLFTQDSDKPLQDYLRLDPQAMVNHWQWYRLLTASFVADNPWHLLFALVIIWLIGHELEELVGGLEFFMFTLVTTMLSNLALTVLYRLIAPQPADTIPALGPIAPAMAMLAWAVALSPQRTVNYFFVPMPFWIVGFLTIVIDWFFFQQRVPYETRFAVHLVSVSFAFFYAVFEWRLTGWSRWIKQPRLATRRPVSMAARAVPKERVYQREAAQELIPSPRTVDEQLEAKLDAILEKVSLSGMDSLTEQEKTTLQRASEVMKRRKGTH